MISDDIARVRIGRDIKTNGVLRVEITYKDGSVRDCGADFCGLWDVNEIADNLKNAKEHFAARGKSDWGEMYRTMSPSYEAEERS